MSKSKLPKSLATVTPREGEHVLVLCPGYWGKGETPQEAVSNMEWSLDVKAWIAYSVHPEAWVNDFGQITRPCGTPAPLLIARS